MLRRRSDHLATLPPLHLVRQEAKIDDKLSMLSNWREKPPDSLPLQTAVELCGTVEIVLGLQWD